MWKAVLLKVGILCVRPLRWDYFMDNKNKYLGRLAGRYVKKNTFNKVATIARQN